MTDEQIEARIDELVAEEQTIERDAAGAGPNETRHERLEALRVELDRLWDLLRQRRALRNAGQDPDAAAERSADTVERYWQ
jgi:hypothetical protein